MLDEKQIKETTNLRNWAMWLAQTCQEDLDNANCPPDDGDCCGVETQAKYFLENAKEHFEEKRTGVVDEDGTHSDEFCPFCGLEEEDEISDPREVHELSEVITPWAAGLDK